MTLNSLRISIVLVLVLCIFSPTETQSNYCSRKLCNGRKHIACNNNGNFKAACTSSARMITITSRLRRAILNKHNGFRNRVARGRVRPLKRAKRMATMRWSAELAKLAALNVKQCVMKHDKCRNTRKFPYAGQNLAMTGWGGKPKKVASIAMSHIQQWFNEHRKTTMVNINRMPARKLNSIGHFTAMVQEKSTHVGCAILRQQKRGKSYQFMACNYAYTNIIGKAVYRRGRVGSKCRTGRNPRFRGLCSVREKYAVKVAGY